MVVSLRNDKLRICLDLPEPNEVIKREHHPTHTVEKVVTTLPNAKVSSVLDVKSGFLQIKLDNESSSLTCFNMPFGRYGWLRLPFRLKCSPEIFQRIMYGT